MKSVSRLNNQSGAVSLFVVIFAILLMSVVTIGFLRIMTSDQNKATGNDLAQSAYDSAQAGVEDAKRALLWYTQNCTNGATHVNCVNFINSRDTCNASIAVADILKTGDIKPTGGSTATGEVKVQQSTAVAAGESIDKALDQAYTCVKMEIDTDDYVGILTANQSVLVPLIIPSTDTLNSVTVEWFSREDVSNATGAVDLPAPTSSQQLVKQWPLNRPSVMRTQFMQTGSGFRLTDFDSTTAASQSNANTVFLYPAQAGFADATLGISDIRKDPTGNSIADTAGSTPLPTRCSPSVASGGYACSITLTLPEPVSGGTNRGSAFLRLTSMYNGSHFRITLTGTQFRGVQPVVDSTGRANDVFRRVESRVDLYDTAFPYPEAAVDTAGSLCKDFAVTDTQYIPGSTTCTP